MKILSNLSEKVGKSTRIFTYCLLFCLPYSVAAVNLFASLITLSSLTSKEFWSESRRIVKNPMVLLVIFMYLLIIVGIYHTSGSTHEIYNTLNRYKKLLLIPLVIPHFQQDKYKVAALQIFTASVFLNVLISWSEFYGFTNISDPIYQEPHGNGVFRWHITQGILFVTLISICTGFILNTTSKARRLFYGGILLLATTNVLFVMDARNGKATIPLLAIWAFLEYLQTKNLSGRLRVLVPVLATTVILGATVAIVMNPQTRLGSIIQEIKQTEKSGTLTSQGGRVEFWRKGITLFETHPLIGYGTGSVYFETGKLAAKETTEVGRIPAFNLHNEFLMWAVQWGIFGLASISLFFILWFRSSLYVSRFFAMQIRGQWLIFATGCLYNSYLVDFTEGYIITIMLGVLISPFASKSTKKPPEFIQNRSRIRVRCS